MKYVAIWDERLRDYKWYEDRVNDRPPEPLPLGCVETTYRRTGRFITRDGKRAEVLEELIGKPSIP